jgi:hypothetical protein
MLPDVLMSFLPLPKIQSLRRTRLAPGEAAP